MPTSAKNRSPWRLGHLVTLVGWLYMFATMALLLTSVVDFDDLTGT